ncbi:MAG: hypothetical protein EZS28_003213, partial [Streblomastix strix]
KKLNNECCGLHKDHFSEPDITKTKKLNKNRELDQKAFVIFTPQNISSYYATLAQGHKRFQEKNEVRIDRLPDSLLLSKGIENKESYMQYNYNRFQALQQLKDKIDQVYELEKSKPYKVYFSSGSIYQKKQQVRKHQQTLDEYNYSYTRPSADNSYKTLPNTVVRDKQTNDYFKQKAVDLLSDYQDTNHEDSATLKVALFSFLIINNKLPLVASFVLHPEIDQTRTRVSDAIKLFLQFHDINPSSRLNSDDKVMKTRQNQPEQFSKFEEHLIDNDYLAVNVLLVPLSYVNEIHAMYISEIDKVINGKLCHRNCQKIFNTKNSNYNRDLARHLKVCYGPETAKYVKLDHLPKLYYIHISNNKLLQKLIATGQQELLSPTLNYITFDFETVENIINVDNLITQLEPLSVASSATINDQITMLYFVLRNESDFIEQWTSQFQDEYAKRDTTNNVTEDDIDWIRDKVASETCHPCHNKFTKESEPTFDRIDNSIGHTKQNCQLACQICNTVKADKDNDISKLKIQLMKQAIHEHLPMTINNEYEYNMLKECMQGGLANVYH